MAKQLKRYAKFYGLDELIAADVMPQLEEDDLTIVRVQEKAGVGYNTAKRLLEKWTKEGKVVSIGKRRNKAAVMSAWRLVEK